MHGCSQNETWLRRNKGDKNNEGDTVNRMCKSRTQTLLPNMWERLTQSFTQSETHIDDIDIHRKSIIVDTILQNWPNDYIPITSTEAWILRLTQGVMVTGQQMASALKILLSCQASSALHTEFGPYKEPIFEDEINPQRNARVGHDSWVITITSKDTTYRQSTCFIAECMHVCFLDFVCNEYLGMFPNCYERFNSIALTPIWTI